MARDHDWDCLMLGGGGFLIFGRTAVTQRSRHGSRLQGYILVAQICVSCCWESWVRECRGTIHRQYAVPQKHRTCLGKGPAPYRHRCALDRRRWTGRPNPCKDPMGFCLVASCYHAMKPQSCHNPHFTPITQ